MSATGQEFTAGRRFHIHSCLGRGGFGEVYRATMSSSGGVRTEVAVKILREDIDPGSEAVKRLRDEGRLLGALRHPAILRVHDLVLLEGRVALITEFVEGQDLDRCIAANPPIPLRAVIAVVGEVAAALDAAWNSPTDTGEPIHLVHRDIKPANIRIGKHGEVKLLDFGIARATNVAREAHTGSNAMMGSYLYMAPERFHNEAVEPPSDIYALGCVLFEGLARRRFFEGMNLKQIYGTMMSARKFNAHLEARFKLLDESLPGEVLGLLRSLLHPEAAQRPIAAQAAARCEDLVEELEGTSLKRWARRREWPPPQMVHGSLDGRELEAQTFVNIEPTSTEAPPVAPATPLPKISPESLPPINVVALTSPDGHTPLDAPHPKRLFSSSAEVVPEGFGAEPQEPAAPVLPPSVLEAQQAADEVQASPPQELEASQELALPGLAAPESVPTPTPEPARPAPPAPEPGGPTAPAVGGAPIVYDEAPPIRPSLRAEAREAAGADMLAGPPTEPPTTLPRSEVPTLPRREVPTIPPAPPAWDGDATSTLEPLTPRAEVPPPSPIVPLSQRETIPPVVRREDTGEYDLRDFPTASHYFPIDADETPDPIPEVFARASVPELEFEAALSEINTRRQRRSSLAWLLGGVVVTTVVAIPILWAAVGQEALEALAPGLDSARIERELAELRGAIPTPDPAGGAEPPSAPSGDVGTDGVGAEPTDVAGSEGDEQLGGSEAPGGGEEPGGGEGPEGDEAPGATSGDGSASAGGADSREPPPNEGAGAAPAPQPHSSSASLKDQGWRAVEAARHDSALSLFDRALAQDNEDPHAWYGRGYALLELDRRDEASEALCRSLEFGGGNKEIVRDVNGILETHDIHCR